MKLTSKHCFEAISQYYHELLFLLPYCPSSSFKASCLQNELAAYKQCLWAWTLYRTLSANEADSLKRHETFSLHRKFNISRLSLSEVSRTIDFKNRPGQTNHGRTFLKNQPKIDHRSIVLPVRPLTKYKFYLVTSKCFRSHCMSQDKSHFVVM